MYLLPYSPQRLVNFTKWEITLEKKKGRKYILDLQIEFPVPITLFLGNPHWVKVSIFFIPNISRDNPDFANFVGHCG